MTLTWIDDIGSYPLDSSNGIHLVEGTRGLMMPRPRTSTSPYLSADGSALTNQRFQEREIDIRVIFTDTDFAYLRYGELGTRLNRGPGTLRHSTTERTRDLLNVVFDGGMRGDETGIDQWRSDVFTLLALDPWWYGSTQVLTLSTAANEQYDEAEDYDQAESYDGTAANSVTNAGDDVAYPVTTITGPWTTLTVGVSMGSSLSLAAALGSGDVITINTKPGERGPRLNGGSIDWSLLTAESRLFDLPRGVSSITIAGTGSTGSSAAEMTWRERFLTP